MHDKPNIQPLVNHLCHSRDLSSSEAERIVAEVIAYFDETPEDFIRRRHLELKQDLGLSNPQIFSHLETEMAQLVFAAPTLSQRQIRRIIYG